MISLWVKVVPSGFDGFVTSIPLTRSSRFFAVWYASSRAGFVILNPVELLHFIGTISTPVLHFRSLSNLEVR